MRSKIIALASAAALAAAVTMVASTDATALRLPDDVYYYSGVTRAFGHTPRHYGYVCLAWTYADPVAYCARRFRSYDPSTGTYLDRHGVPIPARERETVSGSLAVACDARNAPLNCICPSSGGRPSGFRVVCQVCDLAGPNGLALAPARSSQAGAFASRAREHQQDFMRTPVGMSGSRGGSDDDG